MPFYKSRKFWLLILDTAVSLLTYFIGKYAGAQSQDLLFIIGALQPVFATVIYGIAKEDAAAKGAGLVYRDGKYQPASPADYYDDLPEM